MPPSQLSRALQSYADQRSRGLEDLERLVRIPSVSFDGFDASQVRRSAEAVVELLRQRGFEGVRLIEL